MRTILDWLQRNNNPEDNKRKMSKEKTRSEVNTDLIVSGEIIDPEGQRVDNEGERAPLSPIETTEDHFQSHLHFSLAQPDPQSAVGPRGKAKPIGFRFNAEKRADKGEDADPVCIWNGDKGALAVFDGMGGAGSTTYLHRGQKCTGAYIASRLAAYEVERFLTVVPLSLPLDNGELKERLHHSLKTEVAYLELDVEPTRLKSKLIRRLPTTMALMCLEDADTSLKCQSLWAGDSRCYALSPAQGLHQLTEDNLRDGGDALANLKDDSLISNCLNADGEFEICSLSHEFPLPLILLAATDGCFGFLFSPAHFEFLLIDTLLLSNNALEWKTNIEERLKECSGDDCSMGLLALGWTSFDEVKSSFQERHAYLYTEFVEPLDALTHEITRDSELLRQIEERKNNAEKQRELLRQNLWSRYKATHDQFLPSSTAPSLAVSEKPKDI